MNESALLPRFDLRSAGRALGAILRDPDDLPNVFTLIESLSGTAPHRLFLGFRTSKTGARLLRERPDIVPILADREALRTLPAGTLGRAYLEFTESEGISPEGIRDASYAGSTRHRSPVLAYLHERMRDTHDLWHVVTGYKGDVLGEISLLAFTLGQHWNSGVGLIVFAAMLKGFGRGSTPVILDGWKRGCAAAWLPAQEWETLLPLPLEEVRARLSLGAPPVYTEIRSSDLRAEGIV